MTNVLGLAVAVAGLKWPVIVIALFGFIVTLVCVCFLATGVDIQRHMEDCISFPLGVGLVIQCVLAHVQDVVLTNPKITILG